MRTIYLVGHTEAVRQQSQKQHGVSRHCATAKPNKDEQNTIKHIFLPATSSQYVWFLYCCADTDLSTRPASQLLTRWSGGYAGSSTNINRGLERGPCNFIQRKRPSCQCSLLYSHGLYSPRLPAQPYADMLEANSVDRGSTKQTPQGRATGLSTRSGSQR